MIEGTIVNGQVRLDSPAAWPDGTRVRLFAEEGLFVPPGSGESREDFLASLRASHESGPEGDVDARAFLRELAVRHGLPLMPGE